MSLALPGRLLSGFRQLRLRVFHVSDVLLLTVPEGLGPMVLLPCRFRVQRLSIGFSDKPPPPQQPHLVDSRRRDFSLYHGVKVRSPRGAGSLLLFVPKRLHLDLPCSKAFQADGGP